MSEQAPASYPPPADPSAFPPAPVAPPEEKSGAGKKILGVLGTIVVILVIVALKFGLASGLGALWDEITGSVTTASVGDCITKTEKADASDAKVVDCTSPDAVNKVVGIVEDKKESEFTQDTCAAFPDWENAVWYGSKNGKGDIWCLEPIKK